MYEYVFTDEYEYNPVSPPEDNIYDGFALGTVHNYTILYCTLYIFEAGASPGIWFGGGTLGRRFSLISPSKYFWKILQNFSQIL